MKLKLHFTILTLVLAIPGLVATTQANEDDDTLRFYLAKSPLVVAGEIISPVELWAVKPMKYYKFNFRVREVLQGALPADKPVHITIAREDGYWAEGPAFLQEGETRILFLKPSLVRRTDNNELTESYWQSADQWFGAQPDSYEMCQRLKKLAALMQAERNVSKPKITEPQMTEPQAWEPVPATQTLYAPKLITHCPLHDEALQADTVAILYGRIAVDMLYARARNELFPYSKKVAYGGCGVNSASPKTAELLFCRPCRTAEQEWAAAQSQTTVLDSRTQ